MKIFAIVVTYNGKKWYDRCLGSLRDSETPVETIVIDNASSDGTVDYIKEHFPDVHLIESKENLGFAKANNIGIRYAIDNNADYVFLLNQDAWVEKDTLTVLLRTFEDNENVGIVAPLQLNGSYTGFDQLFASNTLSHTDMVSDLYMDRRQAYYEVQNVNAAAWLLSTKCIKKVGGFDTSLFLHYGEDDNYCQRVVFHGFRIMLSTMCTFCHDREFRKNNEKEYREKMIKRNPFHEEKIMWGNINVDIDIDSMIKSLRISILKSRIKLSTKRIPQYKDTIEALRLIKSSREINMRGGMNWL